MDPNSLTNNTSSPDAMAMQLHHKPAWTSHNYTHLYHGRAWFDSRASMVFPQNPPRNFNLNDYDDEDDKEGMFEKPLTPSDVGKLNRLVIPKQHAEKYFPLGGDSGLLLGFEDDSGKCWRFRYSYWNSSQSYVLTKGWSRYVKDNQLDAGDVVFFQRHRTDGERFFIGWRRRNAPVQEGSVTAAQPSTMSTTGGEQWTRVFYPAHHGLSTTVTVPECTHAGTIVKRLRLFGVNLECCSQENEPSTPDGSIHGDGAPNYHHYYALNHQNHMETSCSGNVKQQMRRDRG